MIQEMINICINTSKQQLLIDHNKRERDKKIVEKRIVEIILRSLLHMCACTHAYSVV